MARPRKPALVRELEGNRSRTPIPTEIVARGRPDCPTRLTEDERELWLSVVESLPFGLLTAADNNTLERMAVAWARWRKCQDDINKRGLFVRVYGSRALRQNPNLDVQKQAAMEMHRASSELGLSPVARTRLTADGKVDADPLELLLDGRRDGAYYAPAPPRRIKHEEE
jgi:P27 family predicted phage terminase small subunit